MNEQTSVLRQIFIELSGRYSGDQMLAEKLWEEIYMAYSEKGRHYHTLAHLANLLSELENVKSQVNDRDVVLFTLFYHDIVYRATGDKNEEKSAQLAQLRLTELSFPQEKITRCIGMILATKGHTVTGDNDTDYFTDADLSILGQTKNLYSEYARQVRKEYSVYPAFIYNQGRKKVLNHFLNMTRIYKTSYFFDHFELQARDNMKDELKTL